MKLENRKQKVISLTRFLSRMGKYSFFAFLLISISVFIGAAGYHFFNNQAWLDSFHMACMILTGMGPVSEMMNYKAKLFSSFYALYSGIAFLSITGVFFAPIVHRVLHILQVENDEE